MKNHVYLCYSSWDKPVVEIIYKELESAGMPCWVAPRDIKPGEDWLASISKAIDNCQIFVLVLSSRSNSSRNVNHEIVKAVKSNKHIVPLLVEDFKPDGTILNYIQNYHILDATKMTLLEAVHILSANISQTFKISEVAGQLKQKSQADSKAELKVEQNNTKNNTMILQHYDVFISYRRKTDAQTARLIRAEIQRYGYTVFLDVENLRPGHFDEELLERIEEASNFVLILSEGSLDHCDNLNDWMRKEITHAITKMKKIIPIMMPGFNYPAIESLPVEIQTLPLHHSINYSHDFFDAMMVKIIDYLS